MTRGLFICLAALGLSACETGGFVDETSRQAAKRVVTPIVVDKFPGRNTAAYTDCVIDNATTEEIFDLARASVTGVDEGTVNTVVGIATRGGTLECILKAELVSGLG